MWLKSEQDRKSDRHRNVFVTNEKKHFMGFLILCFNAGIAITRIMYIIWTKLIVNDFSAVFKAIQWPELYCRIDTLSLHTSVLYTLQFKMGKSSSVSGNTEIISFNIKFNHPYFSIFDYNYSVASLCLCCWVELISFPTLRAFQVNKAIRVLLELC